MAAKKRKKLSKSKRQKRRRRRLAILFFWSFMLFAALLVLAAGRFLLKRAAVWFGGSQTQEEIKTVSVDEIKESADWDRIFENRADYPEELIEALEKNPELLDFVRDYPNAPRTAAGGITAEEAEEKHPLFLQWDTRWGYVPYGDAVIGLSGCAPTCLSMVVYSLTRDKSATPDAFAQYSTERGYYVEGTGTSWELLTDIPAKYKKVKAKTLGLDETAMKNHLRKGHLIICSMGPGDFTEAGHFIVLYGYGDDGFYVNDPYSRIRSGRSWEYEELKDQIKNLWVYELRG